MKHDSVLGREILERWKVSDTDGYSNQQAQGGSHRKITLKLGKATQNSLPLCRQNTLGGICPQPSFQNCCTGSHHCKVTATTYLQQAKSLSKGKQMPEAATGESEQRKTMELGVIPRQFTTWHVVRRLPFVLRCRVHVCLGRTVF